MRFATLAAALVCGSTLASATARAAPTSTPTAATPRCVREVLGASAGAYRARPALRETLRYVVEAPGSEREPKRLAYGSGPGTDAFVEDPSLLAVAANGRLVVLRGRDAPTYVARPYEGDLRAALDAAVGDRSSLFEPAPLAMRTGKPFEAWVDAFRFNVLGPLEPAWCRRRGRVHEIGFRAENGRVRLEVDARTHLLSAVSLELRPPGAPERFVVRVEGVFTRDPAPRGRGVVPVDLSGKAEVATFAELGSRGLAPGTPAPDFALEDLAGRRTALRDLRGKVVVLDFWATWCVPCWAALRESQALAERAAAEGLPLAVLAVSTLEQLPTAEAKRARVTEFWRSQGLALPVLLDLDGAVFEAYRSPGLPSVVLVGPDGLVRAVHTGTLPDAVQTLLGEVRAASGR